MGRKRFAIADIPDLQPGFIVQVQERNWRQRLSNWLFWPRSHYFHHFLIASRQLEDGDYVIIESIDKGPAVGVLSFYDPARIRILYAKSVDYSLHGRRIVEEACKFGRLDYHWMMYPKIAVAVIAQLIKRKKPPWSYSEFKVPSSNKALVCTELVIRSYRNAEVPLIWNDEAALPATFEAMFLSDVLKEYIRPVEIQNNYGER